MAATRAGLIVAAGASERMGQPKALLPWHGTTLVEYAVRQARQVGVIDLVVVLGPATRDLRLDAHTAFNPDPSTGRGMSIRLGAESLPDGVTGVLVQSVDQPVPAEVLSALFEAVEAGARVALPTYRGRRGHPVCIAGDLLAELRALSEQTQGLRAVVRRHQATEVPVDSEAVTWNLNDPGVYAAARAVVQP